MGILKEWMRSLSALAQSLGLAQKPKRIRKKVGRIPSSKKKVIAPKTLKKIRPQKAVPPPKINKPLRKSSKPPLGVLGDDKSKKGQKARKLVSPAAKLIDSKKRFIGRVTHYFPKAGAAALRIEKGTLKITDVISIEGPKGVIRHTINSMQIDRRPISIGKKGDEIGLALPREVYEGDQVFLT
jgi:hypothetical protein